MLKSNLRKKFLKIRREFYDHKKKIQFKFIIKILNKIKKKNIIIGGYYPVSHEIDCLNILKNLESKKFTISLPVIKKNHGMDFHIFSFKDVLKTNLYGIPEPIKKKPVNPDVLFVPLVAFDRHGFRLGYGGGFYDRYIKKLEKRKSFLSIGFAYSFQEINKIPKESFDKPLDLVITEKKIHK